jgi:hypothetical protein
MLPENQKGKVTRGPRSDSLLQNKDRTEGIHSHLSLRALFHFSMFQGLLFLEYVADNSLDPPVVAISSLLLFKNSSLILVKLRTALPLSMYMGAGQSDFVREAQCTVDSSALSPMAGSRGKTWLGALSNHAGYDSTIGPGRGAS